MHPGARLEAAIELLDEIDRTPRPADAVISAYFRARRYIGSKDRAAVAEAVYGVMRRHARLAWWIERAGHGQPNGRARVIADEVLVRGRRGADLARLFDGERFSPAPLGEAEWQLAKALYDHTLDHPHMPDGVRTECPDWAEAPLRWALGDGFEAEMAALGQAAPLDLRVNPVRGTREDALSGLRALGIRARRTKWSPLGIRVEGRPPLAATEVFRSGLVEIQDEGSQLVAVMCDAKPGQQVVDFCSGAGGKALALGAAMGGKGRLVACDVLGRRLERAAERFRRAGLHNVETRALSSERDPWVKRHKLRFDRVLVDAPCTGTGTWRRNPDSKWRPLGPGLGELVPIQAGILESAARLVRPGGRLVYATCSLLPDENEDQVARFLEAHPDFAVLPMPEVWAATVGTEPPGPGPFLSLTPARHDTDGFFAAALERRA